MLLRSDPDGHSDAQHGWLQGAPDHPQAEGHKRASISIIAMTANAFDEDKRNAYRAGMNGHLAKPIKIDELMAALTEFLR